MLMHRIVGIFTLLLAAFAGSLAHGEQETDSLPTTRLPAVEAESAQAETTGAATDVVADESLFFSEANPPSWTVHVGATLLWRSQPRSQELLLDNFGSYTSRSLNADQLTFNMQAGPDVTARWQGDRFGLDGRYFGVENMTAQAEVPALQVGPIQPPGSLRGLPLNTPVFIPVFDLDFDYHTSLQSLEVNIRSNPAENVDLLAGFRYLLLRDDLGLTVEQVSGLIPTSAAHSIGTNRLAGAQLGVDTRLWLTARWRLDSVAKAGIYGNAATCTGRYDSDYGSQYYTIGRSLLAFAGELDVNSELALSKRWSAILGGQLLWLAGVTLASDQTASYIYSEEARVDDGDVLFLGVLIGLQAAW